MKTNCSFFLLLLGLGLNAQIINFPSANFKARLLEADVTNGIAEDFDDAPMKIDANNNGEIEVSEALAVKNLELYRFPYDPAFSIVSMEGIQNFTNLVKLRCPANDITVLPTLTALTHLTYLDCAANHLTNVQEVENNASLEILDISYNPVTVVNLSALPNLYVFNCRNTLVSCIDLTGTVVREMWCDDNPNLINIIIQNGIVSTPVPSRMTPTVPPPLPAFNFTVNPNLQQVCYDDGEYEAVFQGFFGELDPDVAITINCNAVDCMALSNPTHNATVFSMFPNPVSNELNIVVPNDAAIKSVTIYNALGQKVIDGMEAVINVSQLTSGTYFVIVETDSGTTTQKLIKQ